jgi:hypothetical protein
MHHEARTTNLDLNIEDEPSKVDDLWFNDGTLVLRAEKKLFRVYGGFLGTVSSFFHHMLSIRPPEEGNVMFEGCPIIVLDDSANDLTSFLKAIFYPRSVFCTLLSIQYSDPPTFSFFEAPPTPTDLRTVESVLRLSCKYDAAYFKSRALSHLNSTFPMTLNGWNNRDKNRTIPPLDPTPFTVIQIAREFDLDWLLPSVLYCICSHPIEETLDPSLIHDEEVRQMCINGRQKLLVMQAKEALHMSTNPVITSCSDKCPSTMRYFADVLCGLETAGLLNYFEDITSDYPDNFCRSCRADFGETCTVAGQKMWNELPTVFGLSSWENLEKKRLAH